MVNIVIGTSVHAMNMKNINGSTNPSKFHLMTQYGRKYFLYSLTVCGGTKNHSMIKDFTDQHNKYKIINKEIPTDYTYANLLNDLIELKTGMTDAFRINIAFGFTLFNPKDEEYKYYYASNNNFLFETAYQISVNQDLKKFFHKVVGLDLVTNYYLKKPSSEWIVAGLNNVSFFIFPIEGVLIGAPIELPPYITNARSIHALVRDQHSEQ